MRSVPGRAVTRSFGIGAAPATQSRTPAAIPPPSITAFVRAPPPASATTVTFRSQPAVPDPRHLRHLKALRLARSVQTTGPDGQPHHSRRGRCCRTLAADFAVEATANLRQVEAAIGRERVRLMQSCIIENTSWLQLGRQLHCDAKTAQSLVAEAIWALALHDQGQPVPAPPVPRMRITP
jgi:hypothetical protein